ncbi:Hypothetical protein CINCED_3A011621 [Cinara cedri]|uniref:Uncharacterized protein n=1 Tax=Cinara cedri TaxID=506608 RepID=A0A5E4MGU2_9HEMI|nr:Hypothetical protein CINCED_3A011621 [Cinara cedri]
MASFKCLIFIALCVYTAAAQHVEPTEDGARVKKQTFIAPAPIVAYSSAPGAYSYGYSTYGAFPYSYPTAAYPAAAYPAPVPYVAKAAYAAYPAYPEKAVYAAKAAYPAYANDDGSYWPGKYEKTYVPAAYPTVYHY